MISEVPKKMRRTSRFRFGDRALTVGLGFFRAAQPVQEPQKLYRFGPYYARALASSTPAKIRRTEPEASIGHHPENARDNGRTGTKKAPPNWGAAWQCSARRICGRNVSAIRQRPEAPGIQEPCAPVFSFV